MRFRFQPWQLAVVLVVFCVAAIAIMQWRRATRISDASHLLQCLPVDRSVKLYIDFEQLRASGLLDMLAGAKTAEEADYRSFVEQTGFDYRTDLDGVAVAFLRGDVYFAVKGHFDWKRLSEYARAQQGWCRNTVCSMPASQPNRFISFYPLSSDVLALAVSGQDQGVSMITPLENKKASHVPPVPVWVSAPSFVFTDLSSLPAGSSLLSPLANASQADFSVNAAAPSAGESGGFQIVLDAPCPSPEIAATVAREFSAKTELLRNMIQRQHMTPNPADLSGVLVAGRFAAHDSHMTGTWPIDRRFFESLVTGKVQ